MRFGSLVNLLTGTGRAVDKDGAPVTPVVGMGATALLWSDRHAGTIVEVLHYQSGPRKGQIRAVVWQRDKATRVDRNGPSDTQSYAYEPNPQAPREVFTLRADGRFVRQGGTTPLALDRRDEYIDPHV